MGSKPSIFKKIQCHEDISDYSRTSEPDELKMQQSENLLSVDLDEMVDITPSDLDKKMEVHTN